MSVAQTAECKRKPTFYRQLCSYKWNIFAILTPIVFAPIPILYKTPAARCAYSIIVMALYWMTEAVPMAVTALLPVVFMPWFGIMDARDVCQHYLQDANMLFFGGLMIAVAVEKWNLHKRVALRVLMLVGSKPIWIMFGFMNVTAFLSMWLSNTATTAMMCPIAHAVLKELDDHQKHKMEQVTVKDTNPSDPKKPGDEPIQLNVQDNIESKTHMIEPLDKLPDVTVIEDQIPDSTITFNAVDHILGYEVNEACVAVTEAECDSKQVASEELLELPNSGQFLTDPSCTTFLDAEMGMPKNESSILLLSENQPVRKRYISNGGQSFREIVTITGDERLNGMELVQRDEGFKNFSKALKLSIAYAANIGGTATLTGTGPNIVLKGQADALYNGDAGINFSSWFVLALPNMFLALLSAWMLLLVMFLGPRETFCSHRRSGESASQIIKKEYDKLGKMSFAEFAVMCHFIVLSLLWLTREPEFIPGWGSLMPNKYVTDACIAITVSAFLFLIPSRLPTCFCSSNDSISDESSASTQQQQPDPKDAASECLLDWKTVNKQMPWGVILLLGGGFALADACKVSGLSAVIGNMLISFQAMPSWAIVLVLCLLTVALTTFTSNIATATIFMPILAELAEMANINPLYLMIPVTISASFAFILPVSTPPNAIVFSYGDVKILDMLKAGLPMSLICIVILQLAINTWGYVYFDLGEFPEWAFRGKLHNNSFVDIYNYSSLVLDSVGNSTVGVVLHGM